MWFTPTTPSRSSARRRSARPTAPASGWSRRSTTSARSARRRPSCATAGCARTASGASPIPAVVHGCYRSSRAATLPIAVKDALHSAIGTWSSAVDTYITPSEFARSRYLKAGWPAEQIVVKYNTAPDPGAPQPTYDGGFICLSRLAPEKGVDVLLEAWGQAFPEGGQRLRVVGAGDLEDALRARAATLAGVELTGQVARDRGLEILAGARALVVPSRWYEVFPRIVAEAYALGVPVIASRLGSLAEIVADGETGLHAEPGDPADLARALRRLAGDRELVERLGAGARREYERNLSPKATTDRLLEIYSGTHGATGPAADAAPLAANGAAR